MSKLLNISCHIKTSDKAVTQENRIKLLFKRDLTIFVALSDNKFKQTQHKYFKQHHLCMMTVSLSLLPLLKRQHFLACCSSLFQASIPISFTKNSTLPVVTVRKELSNNQLDTEWLRKAQSICLTFIILRHTAVRYELCKMNNEGLHSIYTKLEDLTEQPPSFDN